MRKIISLFIIFSVSGVLFAQIELFKKNEAGFNMKYEKASVYMASKRSLSGGYILNGKLAFNASFNHYNYDISNVEVISCATSIDYFALRQNENIPLGLIFNGEYEFGYAPIFGIDYNLNSISFNSKILHIFNMSDKFKIIPGGQLLWRYSAQDYYGVLSETSSLSLAIECKVVYKNFYIYPKLCYSDGFFFLSGGLGFILPTNTRRNKKVK